MQKIVQMFEVEDYMYSCYNWSSIILLHVIHERKCIMPTISPVRDFIAESKRYKELADDRIDILVLSGRNCSLSVRDNSLHVRLGTTASGSDRNESIYYRGTVPFSRIVILSKSGNISVDSMYWCRDQGVSIVILDWKGEHVHSLCPEPVSNAQLRRLQYSNSGGVKIAIRLLQRKTEAQYDTVKSHRELKGRDNLLDILKCGMNELEIADYRLQDLEYLRMYEARLALAYFNSFVGLPIHWRPSDAKIVPTHWQSITERSSDISPNGNARRAINPFHVALNYLYGVVEHQLLCLIHSYGLDPSCGFLHADKPGRNSLLYDLIEPHRAEVDDLALKFFSKTVLRRGDITLLPSGQLMLNAEFARYIIASCTIDDKRIKETVIWLKDQLTSL